MMLGAVAREEREWYRSATLATWVMSAWVKRPPTPDKLLGRKTQIVPKDPVADYETLWKEVEGSWGKEH